MGEVAGSRVSWGESWAHPRWPGGLRRMAALALMVACTGCVSHFTVDTSQEDPLIYAPGTAPGKDFNLSLEGFRLGCEQRTLFLKGYGKVELKQSSWAGSNAPVRAHLSRKTALAIADAARKDAGVGKDGHANALAGVFEQLVKALSTFQEDGQTCRLESGESVERVNVLAAEALMRQLPLPYSMVLRNAYNHRVWTNGTDPGGISIDLSPGMRLRLENSLPISPDGLGTRGGHPSSFAAPTYLYFHALTAWELCNPGYPRENKHICQQNSETWDNHVYLSPAGGLARLGLAQKNDATAQVEPSSGLIDLLERQRGGGIGASSYWRLWLPVTRTTRPAIEVFETNGGSPESPDTPMLVSAESLYALSQIDWRDPLTCAHAPPGPTGCHSLHYRVMPVPEIAIRVNGGKEWVPIGTTLQDLLAERLHVGLTPRAPYLAVAPGAEYDNLPAPAVRAVLYRAALEGVAIRRFSWDGTHAVLPNRVVDPQELARFMRLQLLPGDDIQWN